MHACTPTWHPVRKSAAVTSLAIVVAVIGLAACSRSSSAPQTAPSSGSTPGSSAPASAVSQQVGAFGSLGKVCGPGSAKGSTARGVTDSSIVVGTLGDPGSSVLPGFLQEDFDAGDAFVKWCNAAGGINGRKIILNKRDAKLFEGAARTIDACRTDFMLVGGGTTTDAAAVKPRLACGLGAVPGLLVSPEAAAAGLQVEPNPSPQDEVSVAGYRLLAEQDPALGQHLGILVTNISSVAAVGARLKKGLVQSGLAVPDSQSFPYTVANWRPYFEVSKAAGTRVVSAIGIAGYAPFFSGMVNVGYKPDAVMSSIDVYQDDVRKIIAGTPGAPTVYAQLPFLPFELASQVPAVKQEVELLTATRPLAKLTGYSSFSLSAWLLWAKSASECGSALTVNCVLQKAKTHKTWDAGGFMGPVDLTGAPGYTRCTTIMKVTATGFSYARELTKPNQGFFNCDPRNVQKLS
jgi:hypothetical protein